MAIVEGSLSFRPNRCVRIHPPIRCAGPSYPIVAFRGYDLLAANRWLKRTSVKRSVVDQSGRETGYSGRNAQPPRSGALMRSLRQQLRCHASDLLGVFARALVRQTRPGPTHFDALQHVFEIAVRIRAKISSSRNMDYFHIASDLELLPCHERQCHRSPPSRQNSQNIFGYCTEPWARPSSWLYRRDSPKCRTRERR